MSIRSSLGSLRRQVLCTFFRRTVSLGDIGPIVTFTFDDFPRDAYWVGGKILDRSGARGTYYVAGKLRNVSNKLGELFVDSDIHSLLNDGHEIGTQTYNHSSCRALSLSAFREDVRRGIKEMEDLTGQSPTNFAYPYGHITLRSKRSLGPTLMSSRSVIPGLNGPIVDLNLLLANPLYGGIGNSANVESLVEQNVKQKGWLIFYTHDVRPNHSQFGCTPELLESAVLAAASSGARIMTVQSALAALEVSAPAESGLVSATHSVAP